MSLRDERRIADAFSRFAAGKTTQALSSGGGSASWETLEDKPFDSLGSTLESVGGVLDVKNPPPTPAVYIQSAGTTNGWYWEKYSNGRRRAIKTFDLGNKAHTTAIGSIYRPSASVAFTVPSGIFSAAPTGSGHHDKGGQTFAAKIIMSSATAGEIWSYAWQSATLATAITVTLEGQ